MRRINKSRQLSREALKVAEELFANAVDIGLWIAVYTAELSIPQSSSGQTWRAKIAADRFLNSLNYNVIKNAFQTARKRGWAQTVRRNAPPKITAEGRRRLASAIPVYDERRVWDERIHLITYDIPEQKRNDRWRLREHLIKIGCGKLQESVWLTPYNPIDTLRKFIQERRLVGNVIISDIGKDGSLGEEDIRGLVARVYHLEELNALYSQWMDKVSEIRAIDQLALIQYLGILKKDPQLPFPLLPSWWKGEEAYCLAKTQLQKVVNITSTER